MPFLGDRFRAAREARGLTLADVSEQIHIRAVYLDAIEREEWSAIGAPVYTRGFVRTYARYLGLDAEQAVAEYAASSGTPVGTPTSTLAGSPIPPPRPAAPPREPGPPRRPTPPPTPTAPVATPASRPVSPRSPRPRGSGGGRSGRPSLPITILSIIAIVLLGAVGYTVFDNAFRSGAHGTAADAPAAATSSPAVAQATSAAARPASTPALERTLAFTVNERSWVQIAIDGQTPLQATLEKGTTKVFHGKSAVLRVGNAGGVVVTVDGKSLGPLGASGAVVERTFAL